MQNGVVMQDGNSITFDQVPPGSSRSIIPGIEALQFYTDFANPTKKAYTWNNTMPDSIDAFTDGIVAFYFGYAYDLPTIRARAPKLNFGISKFPQIDPANQIDFANYWIEGVSEKSKHSNEAWDFIEFATGPDHAKSYLSTAKKPTALRSLVSTQLEDIDLSTFASQVLTARSWYKGKDPDVAEATMGEMIDDVVAGTVPIEEIIHIAAGKVAQTVRQ
jgi:ABC-type glycerol-3-phosphate transport system substrate-binding protein